MITEDLETTGLVLGRYRLGRRLGAGGFGAVHEAMDEELDRWVAVKVIPSDGETPVRARREAVAAARLEHPGIVAIYDAGEEDGARYLISELVEGRTLAQLGQAEELTDRDVLRVGLALCDGLVHAHERGVVHRDLKPANILVPDRPRTWRGAAKLADFGVAMLAGDDPLTVTGDVVGTLAYMAPEQAAGKRVDHRADLYSLALVLYEALTGVNPVRGTSPAQTANRLGKPVPSLRKHRPDVPDELIAAIDCALHVTPAQRGTLDDLADALEDALVAVDDEGGVVPRHPLESNAVRFLPRGTGRVLHALGAAVIVAVVLLEQAVVPWPAAAGGAFALALLAPRIGWLAAMAAAAGVLLAGYDSDRALALALAVLPVPVLLLRAPRAWSLPVVALVLQGAFPALAGQLRRLPERAAAGALGAWWLLLWRQQDGPFDATPATDLLLLAVWAVAAAILPWLIRGRYLVFDLVAATAWAAALASATATFSTAQPRWLIPFTVLAALIAVLLPRYSEE